MFGYFACKSICSAVSLDSGISGTVHLQQTSKADVEHDILLADSRDLLLKLKSGMESQTGLLDLPEKIAECLSKAPTAYGMDISTEKAKLMTNKTIGIDTNIKVNGQKVETVTSFKHLDSAIIDEGSKPEILSRIIQTTAAPTRLKPV